MMLYNLYIYIKKTCFDYDAGDKQIDYSLKLLLYSSVHAAL